MNQIEFVNGETYSADYGITGAGRYTPLYMITDGKKHFVHNAVVQTSGEEYGWLQLHNNTSKQEIALAKKQLTLNGGKYLTIHGKDKNPLDFLDWVTEQGYTLEIYGELFEISTRQDGVEQFTDFHGNLVEYSAAFHYRIYDADILAEIQSSVAQLPQHYCYRRDKKKGESS